MTDKDENEKPEKPWVVREVPEQTRRDVKAYAAKQGVSMAAALEELVHQALQIKLGLVPQDESIPPEVQALLEKGETYLTQEDVRLVIEALVEIARRVELRIIERHAGIMMNARKMLADAVAYRDATTEQIENQFAELDKVVLLMATESLPEINQERAERGLAPLTIEEVLERWREKKPYESLLE